MEYNYINPFGPSIYFSRLSDEEIVFLQEIAAQTKKKNLSYGNALVGNIETQLVLQCFPNQTDQFKKVLNPHIQNFLKCKEQHAELQKDPYKRTNKLFPTTNFNYTLGKGPWINYQKKHEFNPIHSHNGILSGVVYIDVPIEIEEEFTKSKINSARLCPGKIEFCYGYALLNYYPKTGDVFIFPAELFHTVYPFTSDVERISMSFNVFNK